MRKDKDYCEECGETATKTQQQPPIATSATRVSPPSVTAGETSLTAIEVTTSEAENKTTTITTTADISVTGFASGEKLWQRKADSALKEAAAGFVAGALAKTAVAPIERTKLLLQLQGSLRATATHSGAPKPVFSSAWDAAKHVYVTQGPLAFWRGNTPNVIRQAGTSALSFMLMDQYKAVTEPLLSRVYSATGDQKRKRKIAGSFLSGGLAGGTATTVLYPVEFLRTRLAMDVGGTPETRRYPRGMRDVFCSTLRVDGVRGLYQGYGIALGGVVIYRALHLGGYDALKNEILYRKDKGSGRTAMEHNQLTWTERFLAAQCVSLVAGTICYPIDSVRRRLMMQSDLLPHEAHLRKYRNSFECFHRVFMEEGVRGFYLGLGPNLIRSFGGAVLLVGYDLFKGMM